MQPVLAPWRWLLGGTLHRRHTGQLEYLLSLRHKPPAGPPNPISLGGGEAGRLPAVLSPDAWTTSGGRCRGPVLLSPVPEAAQWVVGLHLLWGKIASQLPKLTPTLTSRCCCPLARPCSPRATDRSCCGHHRRQPSKPPPSSSHRPEVTRAIGTEKQVPLCSGRHVQVAKRGPTPVTLT